MIAKLTGNSATDYYYEKDAIMNPDGKGSNLSWYGKSAEILGVTSEVDQKDFENILNGKYKDIELRNKNNQTSGTERKATDLVFSADKTVSHMALVMKNQDVIDAFNEANDDTVKYVEENYATTRVGKDRNIEKTGNLLIAQAKHSTARPVDGKVDPSLHTHNIIMNTTKGKDGKWRSLSTDAIYQNQAHIQNVFKSNLAKKLKEKGFGIRVDSKGNVAIAGYDQATVDNFSKRKFEIARVKEELRNDPKYAHLNAKKIDEMAQHNFKASKIDISKEDLEKDWDNQHKANGLMSKEELLERVKIEAEYQKDLEPLTAREAVQISVANFNENEVVATEKQITDMSLKMTRGSLDVNDIKNELDRIESDKTNISELNDNEVLFHKNEGGERTFTSKELYVKEREIVEMLSNQKQFEPIMSQEKAEYYLTKFEKSKGFSLSEGQKNAFNEIVTSSDQFFSIQGKPGVGKTTILEAVENAVAEEKGQEYADKLLSVLAPTGKAASGAKEESGIKGGTVDSYLIKASRESQDIQETLKEINSMDREKTVSKEDSYKNIFNKEKKSVDNSSEKKDLKESVRTESTNYKMSDMQDISKDSRFKLSWIKGLPSEEHKQKLETMTKSKELFGFNSKPNSTTFKYNSIKNSFINDKGNYVIRERSNHLGIKRETEILPERNFSSYRKTTTNFKDGTRKENESKTTNLFGKKSSTVDRKWYGKAKKNKDGYIQYKDTLSKKASDLVYKHDSSRTANYNDKDEKLEFKNKDKALLNGAVFKSRTEEKTIKNQNWESIVERKETGSVLAGMIKYKTLTIEKNKENIFGKEKNLEFEKRTEIKVFGKKVDNDFINHLVNKSKTQENKLTFTDIKNKVSDIKTTITSYFDKNDKLEYQNTTNQKTDSVKTVELSKVDNKKTVATVNSYSKEKKDSYKLDSSVSKVVDSNIEKASEKLEKAISKADMQEENSRLNLVDESSMLGIRKTHALVKEMTETGTRGVFIGDINQFKAVDAGNTLHDIHSNTKVIEVSEMNRQRKADDVTKQVVELMTDKKVAESINLLDKQGNLHVETDDKYMNRIKVETLKDQDNTFNVFLTRKEVDDFNKMIRESKYSKDELNNAPKFETYQDKRLNSFDKMNSDNYEKGDKIGFKFTTSTGKTRFNDYEVKEVNKDRNQIVIGSDKKTFVVDLSKESNNITSVHSVEEKSFLKGDRVVFLKNNSKSGLMNGDFATVQKIEGNQMSIKTDDGKYKTVDLSNDKNKMIDHSYSTTAHKSQGMTKKNVNARITSTASLASFNSANVMGSRHSQSYTLSTDNKEELIKKVEQEEKKTTSLDVDSKKKVTSNEDKYKETGFDSTVEKSAKVEKEHVQEKEINKSAEKDIEISK